MRMLFLAALALWPFAVHAQTADHAQTMDHARSADIDLGGQIARQWCSGCHQVSPRAPAKDAVPGFPEIARRSSTNADQLTAFLRKPHGQMPNFDLTEANIHPLVEYILSLK